MKTIILYTSIVTMLTAVAQAQNENVTWSSPATVSGASDVNTQGTFFGSWAPYDGNANTYPVNGVVFQGNSSLPGFSASFPQGDQNGFGGYNNPGTANTNYNTLLQTATYADSGSGSIVVTWSDTPGHTYLIQVWANDGRTNSRTETITGGANTSASLVFGNAPGQYITGTYLADSSGSETITLSGTGSPNGDYPQINLLQIRDITVTTVTNYQSAVLADNPLAYYALSPATDNGTATDLTGNGNNGPEISVTAATGPSPYITNAGYFNGGALIDLSENGNAGLLNFSGPITLEAWAEPSSSSEFADIVAKGYDANSYDEIVIRVNGPYGANYYGSSGSVGDTGGTQATNWTYVVLTSDGFNCSLYINGGLVVQNPDVNGAVTFSDDWVIGNGSSAGNSRLFNGNISEVAIYNHGLTEAQIQSHYYYGMAGTNNLNYAVPIITNQPQPEAAYPAGSATFSVGVLSVLPTTNQWFTNNIPIPGQTNATITLNNVQTGNVANYSVVVGNANGTSTSIAVTLTLLPPGTLQWTTTGNGNNGTWDTDTTANWIDLANDQQTVFLSGEQVLFDDTANVPTTVSVSGTVSPSLITVNSSTNNFNISGGAFGGSGSLVKEGSSILTIDTTGLTGPVTISGGAIYAGNNSLDSASSITVTNSSTLDLAGATFTANTPVTVSGTGLNGEGAIYNSYNNDPGEVLNITMAGNTMFGGLDRWDLASGAEISGAHNLTVDWSGGAGYGQWNSTTIGANVPEVSVTNGSSLGMTGMDTSCQNPGTLFSIASGCQLTFYSGGFNGSIASAGQITIYNGTYSGSTIDVLNGGTVIMYDSGATISASTVHVQTGGIVYMYAPGITFSGNNLIFENNCQFVTYYNSGLNTINNAVTFNGVAHFIIGNHNMVYTNVLSGTGGFVEDYYDSDVVLSASNTYSGPTIIGSIGNTPEVALTGNGSISDSSLIFFGGTNSTVAHLDVSGRSDQTLTLASGQTLAGIGGITGSLVVSPGATLSPSGSNTTIGITTGANSTGTIAASRTVTLDGTTVLKLDGSGVNDEVTAGTSITYGGTLSLDNISGSPLAAGNSFQIFSAASYTGSFASITPPSPGPGLAWGTSQLNIGVLNVVPQPVINSVAASSGNLVFSGTNGTAGAMYYVRTTTNLLTPLTNWVAITTNTFNGSGDFSVTNAITPGTPQRFYQIELAP